MPIGAIEDRIGLRCPCRLGGERRAAAVDAATAHLALCGFFLAHIRKCEVSRDRQNQDLQHRFAGPKDMGVPFDRRFEHDE
jgi:hypothetical protein